MLCGHAIHHTGGMATIYDNERNTHYIRKRANVDQGRDLYLMATTIVCVVTYIENRVAGQPPKLNVS